MRENIDKDDYIAKLEEREKQLEDGWRAAEKRYESRIAKLEKERDDALKDAKIASHIANKYIGNYCDKIHLDPFDVCNSELVTVQRIMDKYK